MEKELLEAIARLEAELKEIKAKLATLEQKPIHVVIKEPPTYIPYYPVTSEPCYPRYPVVTYYGC